MRKIQPIGAGFEDGEMWLQAKNYGQALETGKGREMNTPLEPSERNAALLKS